MPFNNTLENDSSDTTSDTLDKETVIQEVIALLLYRKPPIHSNATISLDALAEIIYNLS